MGNCCICVTQKEKSKKANTIKQGNKIIGESDMLEKRKNPSLSLQGDSQQISSSQPGSKPQNPIPLETGGLGISKKSESGNNTSNKNKSEILYKVKHTYEQSNEGGDCASSMVLKGQIGERNCFDIASQRKVDQILECLKSSPIKIQQSPSIGQDYNLSTTAVGTRIHGLIFIGDNLGDAHAVQDEKVISEFKKENPKLKDIFNVTSSKIDKFDNTEAFNDTILHSAQKTNKICDCEVSQQESSQQLKKMNEKTKNQAEKQEAKTKKGLFVVNLSQELKEQRKKMDEQAKNKAEEQEVKPKKNERMIIVFSEYWQKNIKAVELQKYDSDESESSDSNSSW